MRDRFPSYPATCMDGIAAAQRGRVYPVQFCHLRLRGHIDVRRLWKAIRQSAAYVPEIFCFFDFTRGRFVTQQRTMESVIGNSDKWDLSRDAQLRVTITPQMTGEEVIIGMSHLLADGRGFLQYLYLLAHLYNGAPPPKGVVNHRAMRLRDLPRVPLCARPAHTAPILSPGSGTGEVVTHCLCRTIDETTLHRKASQRHVTVNDVLMTAYVRVLSRRLHTNRVTLPCPADLRQTTDDLTVANQTGLYTLSVPVSSDASFDTTLRQVHREMQRQKTTRQCFCGVRLLHIAAHILPPVPLMALIRCGHSLPSISYTNVGCLNAERLHFAGCAVEHGFLTGSYRHAPDFQLTVSTFRHVCTLNSTLLGDDRHRREGQALLQNIACELENWSAQP